MPHSEEPGVLARTADWSEVFPDGWRLGAEPRHFDAALSRLAPGAETELGMAAEQDLLLCVTEGNGRFGSPSEAEPIAAGDVAWVPRGRRTMLAAGADGLAYLTVLGRAPLPIAGTAISSPGGEAACLLHRVCPACGRMAQESDARYCNRCGDPLPAE
ncbi:hypothetical protein [Streptomyces sp. NPDC058045]|uniref:hypothetical protein n=1 Tax=Streptomyces sp. NPDC058045 TaxID=3346311 RepID=UPI0036E4188C